MKQFLIIAIVLSIAGIVACNKKAEISTGGNNGSNNGNIGLRIKSDGFYTYEYDAKGRVKMMTASNGTKKFYYSDSAITEVEYFLNGNVADINIYKLRPDGLMYFRQIGYETGNTYSTFYYSASRALMTQVDTLLQGPGKVTHQYYRTGNRVDSVKRLYNNITETRIFEYYPDRVNTITNESTGRSYLGISSPNPVKRELTRIGNNMPGVAVSYTYEFDSQNRISKRIAIRSNFPDEERAITYY
jgi:YD repeat-containing protein